MNKIEIMTSVGFSFHISNFVSGGRDSSVIVVTGKRVGQAMNIISTGRKNERFVSFPKS
jgi:hypothetical protein